MNVFIAGETASGKTTTLNAVTTFIHPDAKIVSIEDTPELQVPQKNWIREVAKTEKEDSEDTQTTMLDLLKAALRQRPNAIIVGEIRGVEGNIAFQAMQCIADGYVLKADGSLVNIKELFEKSRLKYGSEIESDKEVVKINNDFSDYYIFSANEDGIIKKTRIKALYKMSKSELIEIETDDGLRLRVTENHKFICNLDGKRREIGAKEILDYRNKKDILIFKPQKIEIEASEKNLWDFIETCDRKPNVVKDNLFRELENTFRSRYPFYVKKIATEIGVNKEKIGGYFIRRSEVVSWNIYKYVMQFFGEKLPEEIKFRFKGARRDIVLKKELNDILYFLGVFFAKGRIRRGKVFLDISEKVAKRVKLPYEIKKDGNRYFISSSSLVWLVKDVFGLDSKNIPDKILKLENNQLRYFIAGMESCAENYTLKTGSPSFWYALGRLIGDDCLYVCYKDGKVIDYRWQIKNANEDEGIRWACDARKVIPNHAKRISTSKDEDSFRTRICGIDRVFIDYLIKKGFIEMPKPPSITTSRAVVKHVPFNRIPKEALGPYLAGWFDSDWTIRKSKNRAIEIRCALDTSRNKGETNGKVLAVEQLEFISYLVTEKILPAIMGIEIRYHPELKSQVDELEIQIRNRVGGEKIRINEYKKGKVGIGVEFRSNKKEFSEVFKWWKENIAPCMYRKDKIEAINELFKGNTEDRKLKLKDKTNKLLTVARKKAEKAPFIFRDREVRLDLLPEKDKEAILYLDSDSGNLTRIVNVKKSEEEETYDISMDCGKYYIGGKYNISFVFDTGHAVMSTFHAASVEKLIQRLAGNPINAPKANIDNLNVAVIQSAVRLPNEKIGRRVVSINEIIGYDSASDSFSFIEVFRWDPAKDEFEFVGNMNSYLLEQKIAFKRGIPPSKKRQIYATLQRRANILEKLHKRGITDFYELLKVLAKAQKEGIF
jgi:flagellar protein FlaI